jgi:hypothetical protein
VAVFHFIADLADNGTTNSPGTDDSKRQRAMFNGDGGFAEATQQVSGPKTSQEKFFFSKKS